MRVLIVEDNKELLNTYKNILDNNFDILLASNLSEATKLIKSKKIDIVLLDIMLPDGEGYDIIPFIKKQNDTIVIIVSALEKEETKRMAYERGADDYMIKPITLFELEFKLNALKKRHQGKGKKVIEIGDLKLDCEELLLSTQYGQVNISYSQSLVFKTLYEKYKSKEIVTKNELANIKELNKTDNFRVHTLISRLRKTIEELKSEKVFIENEYGKGYRLVVMK